MRCYSILVEAFLIVYEAKRKKRRKFNQYYLIYNYYISQENLLYYAKPCICQGQTKIKVLSNLFAFILVYMIETTLYEQGHSRNLFYYDYIMSQFHYVCFLLFFISTSYMFRQTRYMKWERKKILYLSVIIFHFWEFNTMMMMILF